MEDQELWAQVCRAEDVLREARGLWKVTLWLSAVNLVAIVSALVVL